MNNYKFEILKESAESSDEYENHSHEIIADGIIGIIKSNSESCVIGLQGDWGTGKSTIVSILKKKIEAVTEGEPSPFKVFYFDAWAHEGDPLRQIFLQELINEIDPAGLKNTNDRVSKKTKTITTTLTRGTTLFGILFGLSTLLIPLGIALLRTVDFDLVSLNLYDDIYWEFCLGILLSISPIIVTMAKLGKLYFCDGIRSENLKSNLHFLHKDGKETVNQDIDEEYDRSSIDFQLYFNQITKYYFDQDDNNRLIMVIDNLDRIDGPDALKIWSTLQTFLPASSQLKRNNNPGYHKIWTIIPYAERGIAKLWNDDAQIPERPLTGNSGHEKPSDSNEEHSSATTSAVYHSESHKSFLEKSIQIRIEVPNPILTNWESFASKKAREAYKGWPEEEITSVIETLKHTRRSIIDCPTPREIKSYINQVGTLRMIARRDIDTSTIAYYIAKKYLFNIDNESLINSDILTENSVRSLTLPNDYKQQLSSLIYGVPPDIAYQVMMIPRLETALKCDDSSELDELYTQTRSTFVSIFDHYLGQITELSELICFALPINNWNQGKTVISKYRYHVFRLSQHQVNIGTLTKENQRRYIAFFTWLKQENNELNTTLWTFLLRSVESTIDSYETSTPIELWTERQLLIDGTIEATKTRTELKPIIFNWDAEKWIKWGNADFILSTGIHRIIHPEQDLFKNIRDRFKQKKPNEPRTDLYFALHYLVKTETFKEWETLTHFVRDSLQTIDYSKSEPDVYHSSILYSLLLQLKVLDWEAGKDFIPVIETPAFIAGLPKFLADENGSWMVALLIAMNLNSVGPTNVRINPDKAEEQMSHSAKVYALLDAVWKEPNSIVAKNMWNYIKVAPEHEFFWTIADEQSDRLLMKEILLTALHDKEKHVFFAAYRPIARFKTALDYLIGAGTPELEIADFVRRFVSDSTILLEIQNSSLSILLDNHREITVLINHTEKEKVFSALNAPLNCREEEVWLDLINNHHNWSIILEQWVKYGTSLNDAFYNSLVQHSDDWASSISDDSCDLSSDYWGKLLSLLSPSQREAFKTHISEIPFKKSFILNIEFIKANISYFDKASLETNLAENKNTLLKKLTDALKEEYGNFECLQTILLTLKNIDKRKLKFNKSATKTISANLQRLYDVFYIVDLEKNIITDLCSLFGLTLKRKQPSTTNTALNVNNLRLYVQKDKLCGKLRSEIKDLYHIARARGTNVLQDNQSDYVNLISTLKNHGIETLEALQREMLSHRQNMILCFSKIPKRSWPSIKLAIPIYVLELYYRHCSHPK